MYDTMQFPSVSERGHGQQFLEVDYSRLLGVIKKEEKLMFKQDGRNRSIYFSSHPLPLTPPNTRTPYDLIKCEPPMVPSEKYLPPGHKFTVFNQLRYFYTNHFDVYLPVSVATELIPRDSSENPTDSLSKDSSSLVPNSTKLSDHLFNCSSMAHCDELLLWACGPDLSTLGVARTSPPSSPAHENGSFLSWAQCHSPLPINPLQSLSMPGQIRDIQVTKIQGKDLVFVRSDYHLSLLQVIENTLEVLSVHQTQHSIILASPSPYVFGECVFLTLSGELCLISTRSKVTPIAKPSELHPHILCFGAHPRSVIVAMGNTVHKIDWRTSPTRTCVLYECKEQVTCLSHDHSDPFVVVVTTPLHLAVVDVREPGRSSLSMQLNLLKPPTFIASDSSTEENLVMLVSKSECMVVGLSKSPPRRTTLLPHLVTDLRPMHNRLMVAGLSCEGKLCHVTYRLAHPIVGATLWHKDSTYTAAMMTDLGDVFYQSWTYEQAPSSSLPILCPNSCRGYSLWIEEAFAQEKELARYREMDPTGGLLFKNKASCEPIMDYILSPEAPATRLCIRCHYAIRNFIPHIDPAQHPSSLATTNAHCTFCGGVFITCGQKFSRRKDQPTDSAVTVTAASVMATLRECCTPTSATTVLDHTLLSTWPASSDC